MSWLRRFLGSSIGLKVLMASSGLLLVVFVLGHMVGNLQVFMGPDTYNEYAEMLQGNRELLWMARIGLLAAVGAHIYSAVVLTLRSRAARPKDYSQRRWLSGTYAARTMRFGGVVLLAFIVYHLLHFTVGSVHDNFQHCRDIGGRFTCFSYENLCGGFSNPLVAGFYIVAQLCLGLHLAHGVWSMCRTLGMNNPRYDRMARQVAVGFSMLVTVGNISIPVAIMAGVVG